MLMKESAEQMPRLTQTEIMLVERLLTMRGNGKRTR